MSAEKKSTRTQSMHSFEHCHLACHFAEACPQRKRTHEKQIMYSFDHCNLALVISQKHVRMEKEHTKTNDALFRSLQSCVGHFAEPCQQRKRTHMRAHCIFKCASRLFLLRNAMKISFIALLRIPPVRITAMFSAP